MKKTILILVLVAALSGSCFITALAGWIQEDGYWWYQNEDGSYACNGSQIIDGKLYSFDENGHLKEINEHEQKIQHIRDVYNETNSRNDLQLYGGGDCSYTDYADGKNLVKVVFKNDMYLTLPVVECYYEQVWKEEYGYNIIEMIFAYGTDGTNKYRFYYQNGNLIREIGPDGIIYDYPDGDGFQKSSNTKAEEIFGRATWETALFAEEHE